MSQLGNPSSEKFVSGSDMNPAGVALPAGSTLSGGAMLGVAQAFTKGQRGAELPLPAASGSLVFDLLQSNNWGGIGLDPAAPITGNIIFANPSSMPVGQSGVIRITNSATPSVVSYGSYWKPADGLTLVTLTALAGAKDNLVYYVEAATRILVGKVGGSV